jgi:CheY-like chemotaxis protein
MPHTKLVLFIEDEPFAVDWVKRIVAEEFRELCRIENVRSEREFLLRQEELEKMAVDAVILDIILPWEDGVPVTDRTDYMKPRGPIYEAGIRIYEDLKGSARFRDLPLLMYSVTDVDRLVFPEGLGKPAFMSKQAPDFRLLQWIRRNLFERGDSGS